MRMMSWIIPLAAVIGTAICLVTFILLALEILGRNVWSVEEAPVVPDEEKPESKPEIGRLFACFVAGNDAFPNGRCPHLYGSEEAKHWNAGWRFAADGGRIEGREDRLAKREEVDDG